MLGPLLFRPEDHTYWLGERQLPAVTAVLKDLDADAYRFVSDEDMKAAADLGTAVHIACDLDDKNDLDEESLDPQIVPYLAAYRRFKAEMGFVVTETEQKVHHPALLYAGTLDKIGYFAEAPKITELIDLKTTSKIMRAVGPQLWAYSEALKAMFPGMVIHNRRALQLRDDGTYRLTKPYRDVADFKCFVSLLNVHYWKIANAK